MLIILLSLIFPPCVSEDSTGTCLWSAAQEGNGQGSDFLVFEDQVIYLG